MMNGMDKHPDPIDEQAAEHFARRRTATARQSRERDAWLNEDPRHAEAYERLQRLWEHAGRLADDPELKAIQAADMVALRRGRRFHPPRFMAVAATLLMLVGLGYVVLPFMQATPPARYATALGERRTETLADGSQIVLNTDSSLEVRYSRGRRELALLRGEAQFEVARDASRPFVVSIGEDTVTALGTRFQVRREPDSAVITLLKGSVEVARGDEHHVLRPNERAILSARTGIAIAPINPESATGWLEGWLRFHGAPLAEVITEANRYSREKLRLGDPRLADVRISGNFHAGDNASIADAASLILPVRVERRGSEIVLMPQ